MSKHFIVIEGLIGSGKSTLAKALSEELNGILQEEPAEGVNPYLTKYYADPKGYAFKMQIYLLKERFRAHTAAQSIVLSDLSDVVSDRSFFGDRCFAEVQLQDGYFSPDDMRTYLDLHKDMQRSLLYPSCIFYLKTNVKTSMERIAKRMSEKEGRKCECSISTDYMMSLDTAIKRMIESIKPYTHVFELDPLNYHDDGTVTEKSVNELVRECKTHLNALTVNPYDAWQGVI